VQRPCLDAQVHEQIAAAQKKGVGNLEGLLHAGETWRVE
jgi:hypothetical protein